MLFIKSPIYRAVQARFAAAIKQAEAEYKQATKELWSSLIIGLSDLWSGYLVDKKKIADDAVDSVFNKLK